jgi:radical SAM protein with 4Fe4S-binding SPASM domain
MFRISQFMQEVIQPTPLGVQRNPPGPVVIWNLVRRCNLTCKHCYSLSADKAFAGELTTDEAFSVMDDLKRFRVPVLILSGGEPLLRPDIFELAQHAKAMGFYVALSSNGTLINEKNIAAIAACDFDYVGVSLDGMAAIHDQFRRMAGAFQKSLHGIRLCRERGIKLGVRFTLTRDNAGDLPALLQLVEDEGIARFYLSHLNYAGRGNKHRGDDAHLRMTREAMDLLFDKAWQSAQIGQPSPPRPSPQEGEGSVVSRYAANNRIEFTTGNNDADGVYFLYWVRRNFPELEAHVRAKLAQWGGNSSGVNVANIDNLGNVHPDTMWWHHNLGNVRDRPFSEIWQDVSDPIMAGLRASPRQLKGRCGECRYFDICGGNTRVRAQQLTGDPWQEDPACYLTDEEIGVEHGERLQNRAWTRLEGVA